MDVKKLNNKIVIIKDELKNDLLDKISLSSNLLNIKIITLNELKKKYYFDYNNETLYYIMNKYNVNKETSKIYINNLYYIDKLYNEEKIDFLYNLKQDLINNNLIEENELFKSYLINKDIVLYNLNNIDKFYINIINNIKEKNIITIYNEEYTSTKKDLYELQSDEDQIIFVASKICELIKSGIDINNIKLAGVNEADNFIIKKIFKLFNIPVNLNNKYSIIGTNIVNKFIEYYSSDINNTFEVLKKEIKTNFDEEIYNKLISIVNSYTFIDDYLLVKDMIIDDISNINIKIDKYKNAVNIIDLNNISKDDYVFLINFNEGILPVNHKDEDYLNDRLKSILNISNSIELNEIELSKLTNFIKYTNNLIVSYISFSEGEKVYISSAYKEELFNIKTPDIKYIHSNNYNKLKLVSLRDDNKKYGTINDDLIVLNNKYNLEYESYDNTFKGIDKNELLERINNKISLSYSSMNTYYQCAFRYYIDKILKIGKYEDTFDLSIGNICHQILSECFVENYDYDKRFDEEVNKMTYETNNMEKFFLKKVKKELLNVINEIKNQYKDISLKKAMYEKEVLVEIDNNLNISFNGKIDKILYDEFDNKIILAIIDYKTGKPTINLKNIKYGFDMQLPVYIYLALNMKEFKSPVVGGFYLQHIMSNYKNEEEFKKNLKLQGYSNIDEGILKYVDKNYNSSNIISGLKTTNSGFYAYSKLVNDEEVNDLYNVVEDKIKEASYNILDGKFDINPKQIKSDLVGCKYCEYKDLCYMKHKDVVVLGGEEDE